MRKKIQVLMAILLFAGVALGANVVLKYGGPSGQGDLIWVCPATGVTNLVMGTNGITTFTVPTGAGIVYTNASLTITRQGVASLTNASVALARQVTLSMTNIVKQTGVITQVVDGVTNAFTIVTNVTIQTAAVAALTNVVLTIESASVKAVTNVVLSNP